MRYFWDYKYPFGGGLLVAALVIFFFIFMMNSNAFPNFIFGKYQMARLELYIHNTQRVFEGAVVENMTVLEALQASALAGNISFEYAVEKGEFTIKKLNGYDAAKGRTLVFYVNESRINTDQIYSRFINPGDVIVVKTE